MRLSATAARMRSFKADSSTLSPSWMSMARLTFPSRLELNRPVGSFNAAPLANVILTTFLYVPPVQTMPPWDQTGVPIHFHSSTISGSASCMMARAIASVFPRQSPSSLIFWSINAEADFTGTGLFMYNSNSRTYFSCAQRNVRPPQVKAATRRLKVLCNILLGRSFRNKSSKDMAFPHPQSQNHCRKEDIPGWGSVIWKFFKRAIDITEYRNAKDDVNPANNRTFGGFFHD